MKAAPACARELRIRGVVQGVGFRPFAYRLARRYALTGWIYNGESGVRIHVEGDDAALDAFACAVAGEAPPAAQIASLESAPAALEGCAEFAIRESRRPDRPTVRISPDLPVCDACLRELFDPRDHRYRYPFINCTDCGPRYSIVLGLPYDRSRTTMAEWPMCARCAAEYHDPAERRFHAQPLACHACGPTYVLRHGGASLRGDAALGAAAKLLREGAIVAIKGIGGYHLACDPAQARSVAALRERKYRKERPFALMARDVARARELVELGASEEALLRSPARPIVLARARAQYAGVAPDNAELGVMLPYTPLHHMLFAGGAPDALVMTSANRASEPIAYDDADALASLGEIADAFLVGERRIARRIDDSVARAGSFGTAVLRRARGYAPQAVALLPSPRPILAVGGDLKNAVALVVEGQAFVSQHVGDLEHLAAREAFERTIADLCAMYEVRPQECLVAHDAHPGYASTLHALELPGEHVALQHHRAHVASVLAERQESEREIVAIAFDGTGYGDDGTIWGGEVFSGSLRAGLTRVAHLRTASLPGGDAAARFPVQAAAGFLGVLPDAPDFCAAPFNFPPRYRAARELVEKRVRTFATTSVGRLFDTVAALCGFTRESTFEGQAAMWLEHLATASVPVAPYPFPLRESQLDYGPLLAAVVADRAAGRGVAAVARAFHEALVSALLAVCAPFGSRPVVVSGGVFQNRLLLEGLTVALGERLWTNAKVPANDGGICLGQAALAAAGSFGASCDPSPPSAL